MPRQRRQQPRAAVGRAEEIGACNGQPATEPRDHGARGDDMPYYRVTGEIPGKRHVRFRRPDGGLYAEELMGEEGFAADSSLLYHVHPPTAIVKSEGLSDAAAEAGLVANHPRLPSRHLGFTATRPETRRSTCAPALPGSNPSTARSRRPRATMSSCPGGRFTAGCPQARLQPGPSRRWSSRLAATSGRRSATCPSSASSWSTRRTASGTCAAPGDRCWPRARMYR